MHAVEAAFGRVRTARNAARGIDLDLLDYHGTILDEPGITVPHPRLAERAFVLRPLAALVDSLGVDWRHPATGETIGVLLARLPPDQPPAPPDSPRSDERRVGKEGVGT